MKNQEKQIKESFFSPVFQLLPILSFLILEDFIGLNMAWKITFPIAIVSVLYIYYFYNRILNWHLTFTFLFIGICLIAGSEILFSIPPAIKHLVFEIVTLFFLLAYLVFRKKIQEILSGFMSKLIPMTNNFDEMYRFIRMIFIALFLFITIHLSINYNTNDNSLLNLQILQYGFVSILLLMIVYEMVRVQIIRSKLLKEEWWPIVSEQGKIIGSIQHQTSLADHNKYIHPVVRVMIIDKGRILLQKRAYNDIVHSGKWDTSISNHVKMGENIEQCVERTTKERFSIEGLKYMHLSNYTLENENEYHYAFLFVSCQMMDLTPNLSLIDQTKWWTQQQIEDNLDAGIFTENFKIEYDLLLRSGLLETGKCECSCRLKEVIYKQSVQSKSNDSSDSKTA
jgi:isopentenyldiphosphate isomerase